MYTVEGEQIDPNTLTTTGARQVRDAIQWFPTAKMVEARTRKIDGRAEEVVVIDVEPELPQDLIYDIRSVERLALAFRLGECVNPVVTSLREDFPRVPHLNCTPAETPKSLCVYEDPWSEVQLRWTGARFLRDLLHWLTRTAVDELHLMDQAPEPYLFESSNAIIFPENMFDEQVGEQVFVATIVSDNRMIPYTVKLTEVSTESVGDTRKVYCAPVVAKPVGLQAMLDSPENMDELEMVLKEVGIDLWATLRSRLLIWFSSRNRAHDDDEVVILVKLPRLKVDKTGERLESVQYLAFAVHTMRELAVASGRFDSQGPSSVLVPLANGEVNKGITKHIKVSPWRAIKSLDRIMARHISGLELSERELSVVLVGAGALGSQIHDNLSRMGWGRWTIVDQDTFFPHNVTRHRLGECAVGQSKAKVIEQISKSETPHNPVECSHWTYAQSDNTDLRSAYAKADLILDVSTSIAVSRFLARDLNGTARLASLFVNPTGQHVVMLIEDTDRELRLDSLEAQYYRGILFDERLVDHIGVAPGVRYGAGCLDSAAQLAQDDLALASGLLSRQIRTASEGAETVVWRLAEDGSVERIAVKVGKTVQFVSEGWEILLDEDILKRAFRYRLQRIPKETGGVLIGYFDVMRQIVYVVDALPAPRDSVERKESFVRGYAKLREELVAIETRTGGQVGYVGEWHSHPNGVDVRMSECDDVLLETITEEMKVEGYPGVMIIFGENGDVGSYVRT